jgi:hypothetical protein
MSPDALRWFTWPPDFVRFEAAAMASPERIATAKEPKRRRLIT